ncbi:hypothetical protein SAMD00019534_124880 [Acytostelium subglobosum LB1]|uniref:hypothetical protein n=1 Tax=Acytostelium subglobosum LB1 TaxID=1410327 RepID=UPI000644E92E|nr:hypothetical protein SAMD00019534_124880 [Acytostelium subglobosum LB1]GAM29312.1 hypothetical protein SAMD00019534_124880 [Acytostelium subglobosum LB1]|eukprot:XP_012747739.1 hypothetical protein SAMD00019534_124880 [Acytostelium subglobosum LB1]
MDTSNDNNKRTIDESCSTDQPTISSTTQSEDQPIASIVEGTNDTTTSAAAAQSKKLKTNTTQVEEDEEESGGDDDGGEDFDDEKQKPRGRVAPPMLTKEQLIELQTPHKITTADTKKKKVVICVGYSGTNYKGMQKNPGCPTIEEEMEKAIFKVGGITPDNMYSHRKIDWIRCARTDKGVSALRNMVSCKLEYDPPTLEEMKDAINKQLPSDIHIFGIKRVNNTFHAKNCVDRRQYVYITPTFSFEPIYATNRPATFKFDEKERERVNNVLKLFLGTHRYHNYTSKKESNDPSAVRTINSFECTEPFVLEGIEMVALNITGQSFMLHQIRKMVGVTMQFLRKGYYYDMASEEEAIETMRKQVEATFAHKQFNLPMAPGAGLLLDRCLYEIWTQKFGSVHGDLLFDDNKAEIDAFKYGTVYKEIADFEAKQQLFTIWFKECLDPYPLPFNDLIETFNNPPPAPPRKRQQQKGPRDRVPHYRQIKYLGRPDENNTTTTTTTTTMATATSTANQ